MSDESFVHAQRERNTIQLVWVITATLVIGAAAGFFVGANKTCVFQFWTDPSIAICDVQTWK